MSVDNSIRPAAHRAAPDGPRARGSAAAPTPQIGLVLGARYELTERIAVGGMGEVWKALDRRLGRVVAVKVLRPELVGDEQFLARLRTEARNTAGLRHTNLAMLLDHGEADGSGFLVMELVTGETLAERLHREGTLSSEELLPLLAQACRGLHAAHTAGVVHRDVKPANVMITPDGVVKLTDFGISLAANQAPMTSAGMVMGTAHYLPPEQATGRPATPAGDVYALGVLAYECLTGERPFTGASQVEIAFAHVNEPVPDLPGWVPEPVGAAVTRMLAKDPGNRPASALACAHQLEEVLSELTGDVPHTPAARPAAPQTPPAHEPSRRPAAHRGTEDPRRGPDAAGSRQAAAPGAARPTMPPTSRATTPPATPRRRAPGQGALAVVQRLALPAGVSRHSSGRRAAAPARPEPRNRRQAPGRPARGQTRRRLLGGRLPTWRELSADRVWLVTMTVVVTVLFVMLVLVAVTGAGSLVGADRDGAGPPSMMFTPSTVRTTSG